MNWHALFIQIGLIEHSPPTKGNIEKQHQFTKRDETVTEITLLRFYCSLKYDINRFLIQLYQFKSLL